MIVTIVTGLLQPCGNASKPYAIRVSRVVLPLLPPFCKNIRYTDIFSFLPETKKKKSKRVKMSGNSGNSGNNR